jgi:hypothetical protein
MNKFVPALVAKTPAALPKHLSDLIALSDQLSALLTKETAGLKAGVKNALKMHEADKAKIMALYQRELNILRKDPDWAKRLSPPARAALEAAGERLQAALKAQSDLLARRKYVTEGIVQAIAKEVAAKRQIVSPYAKPQGGRAAPPSSIAATAITLNSVV